MSGVDKLKTILHSRFSDGQKKISCYVNDTNVTESNVIRLFYNGTAGRVSQTQSNSAYYANGIQIATRHNDYNKAREISYQILEYINANRKTESGYWWIPDAQSVPLYAGIDSVGGHVWTFDITIKGGN